jgi:hypothetical protein
LPIHEPASVLTAGWCRTQSRRAHAMRPAAGVVHRSSRGRARRAISVSRWHSAGARTSCGARSKGGSATWARGGFAPPCSHGAPVTFDRRASSIAAVRRRSRRAALTSACRGCHPRTRCRRLLGCCARGSRPGHRVAARSGARTGQQSGCHQLVSPASGRSSASLGCSGKLARSVPATVPLRDRPAGL